MHCKACDKLLDSDNCKWNSKLKNLENLCPECLEEVDEVLLIFKRLDNLKDKEYNKDYEED